MCATTGRTASEPCHWAVACAILVCANVVRAVRAVRGADAVSPRTFLVVNADDLGYSSGVNRGIFEAHDRGIVTSTSLMVHRPAAEAAVVETWSRPGLGVGLHFDLGSWADEAEANRDPGVPLDGRDAGEIAADAHGQLDRFRELVGRDPTHLDS